MKFGELNDYLRNIFDQMQKLAQLTFVVNPAVAAGYAYVLSKGHEDLALLGPFFAFIGVVFNSGALCYYILCKNFVNSVIRIIATLIDPKDTQVLKLFAVFGQSDIVKNKASFWLDKLTITYFLLLTTACAYGIVHALIS